MSGLDLHALQLINGLAGENIVLDTLARIFVGDYLVPVVLSLALLGLWFGARDPQTRERQQRAVLVSIFAMGAANFIVMMLNLGDIGERPRPFEVDAHAAVTTDTLFYRPPDPTFPSNSMAVAFAMSACIWVASRRAGAAMAGLGAAMGLARVYTGVHYPGDILVGILVGITASFIALSVVRLIEPAPSWFLRWARRFYLA